jgi:hypothetical protein
MNMTSIVRDTRLIQLMLLIAICLSSACSNGVSSGNEPDGQDFVRNTDRPDASPTDSPARKEATNRDDGNRTSQIKDQPKADMTFCRNLNKVRRISTYHEKESDDPTFFEFVKNREKATPCLIELITNTDPIKDTLSAPGPRDFRTGDAAVFMLLIINNENWVPNEMLPPEFAAKWPEHGIFAYFEAVENPENRVIVQNWWRRWWLNKKNQRRSSVPEN